MAMYPFFPSLRPTVGSSICMDADTPCDDESELREMEKEHVAWLKLIQQTASDLLPFGKVPPVGGPDPDTDDEVGNDDSEDSDSRDGDEDEEEEEMEASPGPQANVLTGVLDTSSPEIFN